MIDILAKTFPNAGENLEVVGSSGIALIEKTLVKTKTVEGGVDMKNLTVASSGVTELLSFENVDPSVFEKMSFEVMSIKPISSIVELLK